MRTFGCQLGVSTILEGSVRKYNNRVRITTQLISVNDGTYNWSKNFNSVMEDIFVLQDEVSPIIAGQICENFGHSEIPEQLVEAPTRKIKIYDHFLKSRLLILH